jgi:hypothetical protein
MAVLQISRIQHRRGLQQDLPQLASAELGWSIDQRRLFIGNGTLGEGAPIQGVTEILTQHTDLVDVIKWYTFKGREAGWLVTTGPSISDPVVRSLQNKFDDFVSVRDFGAVGDGVANDIDAIYRALTEIYKTSEVVNNSRARRTIYFPAGTYRIAASTKHPYGALIIPPWCRIVGDGIDNTHIVGDSVYDPSRPEDINCVLRFADSAFVYDNNIGTALYCAMPSDISIENLSLAHARNENIVYVDSVVNLHFASVQFVGTVAPVQPTATSAISFDARRVNPDNITFESCKFKQLKYAVVAGDVPVSNVRFNNCLFDTLSFAFRLGNTNVNNTPPSNFRITNSVFRKISGTAINCWVGVTGIVSSGNNFIDCGNIPALPAPPSAFIIFRSAGNYSVNDTFDRPAGAVNQVSFSRTRNVQIEAASGIRLGQAVYGMGDFYVLVAGPATVAADVAPAGVMTYQVTDGTNYRTGSVTFTSASYYETFVSDTALDAFTIKVSNGVVTYNAPVSGLLLTFSINHI